MLQSRTLDELRKTEPSTNYDGGGLTVYVNHTEAVLLHKAGATVISSGSRNLDWKVQHYLFENKKYTWLEGYGVGTESLESEYRDFPVLGVVSPRLLKTIREYKEISD
jgi:hypothetical protein